MPVAGEKWFTRIQGQVQGPYSLEQLQKLVRRGTLGRMHEVSQDRKTWRRTSTVTDLFPASAANMPTVTLTAPEETYAPATEEDANLPELIAQPFVELQWFIMQGNLPQGPLTEAELTAMALRGTLQPEDLIWMENMADWVPAESLGRFAFGRAPLAGAAASSSAATTSLVLGLLGWTLLPVVGGFGAVTFGHAALAEARRGRYVVSYRALAGLVLGYSVLVFVPVAALAWWYVYGFNFS